MISIAFPEYVLTAVNGFTLNEKFVSPDEEYSEEEIKGQWEIQSRNELIVTQHQEMTSSDGSDSDSSSDDDEKKKKRKNIHKEQRESITSPKNFNPFADIKDKFNGEKINLVILPKFPKTHVLVHTQRYS